MKQARGSESPTVSKRHARPTLALVAETAGVSPSAVSLVLNHPGKHRYSKRLEDKVLKVCKEMGYKPSFLARSLARQDNPAIAVLCETLSDMLISSAVDRMIEIATARKFHVVVATKPQEFAWTNLLDESRASWLVAIGDYMLLELENLERSHHLDRIILVSSRMMPEQPLARLSVTWDEAQNGRLAVEHLAGLGHKQIAILAGRCVAPENAPPRLRAAYDYAPKLGMKVYWIANPAEERKDIPCSGRVMTAKVLEEHPEVTALYCRQDYLAIGAYHVLHKAGVRIPQDMAVISNFNLQEQFNFHPPLSSISSPLSEGVEAAMKFISDNRADDGGEKDTIDLTERIRLLARESTLGVNKP